MFKFMSSAYMYETHLHENQQTLDVTACGRAAQILPGHGQCSDIHQSWAVLGVSQRSQPQGVVHIYVRLVKDISKGGDTYLASCFVHTPWWSFCFSLTITGDSDFISGQL